MAYKKPKAKAPKPMSPVQAAVGMLAGIRPTDGSDAFSKPLPPMMPEIDQSRDYGRVTVPPLQAPAPEPMMMAPRRPAPMPKKRPTKAQAWWNTWPGY